MLKNIIKRIKGGDRLTLKLISAIVLVPVGFAAFIIGFAILLHYKGLEAVSVIGVLLLVFTVFANIRIINCTQSVTAVFNGYSRLSKDFQHSIVFSYRYEDKQYNTIETVDRYSKRKIKKMFEENKEYTIWLNPAKPEYCIFSKKRAILKGCALIIFSIAGIVLPFFPAWI